MTTAVALVGTRRATSYGQAVAERLARDLAAAGVTVVSGLAKGIDTVAHHAALQAGGRTIAVLGNGLDQVYPAENAGLARQIVDADAGALVPSSPRAFRRTRSTSRAATASSRACRWCTVIVEAGERSGALITADFALEQGRDVLAVPGQHLQPDVHRHRTSCSSRAPHR